MDTTQPQEKQAVWLIDSKRTPLAQCREAIEPWADVVYFQDAPTPEDWNNPPDLIFFSAEISGGAHGDKFSNLLLNADSVPLVAIAQLRSLAQAVSFFRAGVADYLSIPIDEDDAKERATVALERAAALSVPGFMVELEPLDADPGEISLAVTSAVPHPEVTTCDDSDAAFLAVDPEEDILAELPPDSCVGQGLPDGLEQKPAEASSEGGSTDISESDGQFDADDPYLSQADDSATQKDDEDPVVVDGLPIPLLWDELPCGLLVFDSEANLVFANQPALELFGQSTLVEFEDALENNRGAFNALAANHKPLPDNQWPHLLAAKTRTSRDAVISIEKPDRRRLWLKIDCRPHLHDGEISRLLLTAVNLTGDLPSVAAETSKTISPKSLSPQKTKGRARKKNKK